MTSHFTGPPVPSGQSVPRRPQRPDDLSPSRFLGEDRAGTPGRPQVLSKMGKAVIQWT